MSGSTKKQLSQTWLLIGLSAILLINLWWFGSAGPRLIESPFRIAVGALFVFLLPGLVWGEVLRYRARHPWEMVSIGFVLSLLIEIALLPIVFALHARIEIWISLLLALTAIGLAVLAIPRRRQTAFTFLRPAVRAPGRRVLAWFVMLAPIGMAILAFAYGEALFDISGEKTLHLMFVRQYHDMPLSFAALGARPGLPPPNLVNLWEFLIAGWARLTHLDPLLVFFRARCVIPVLGLAAVYLLVKLVLVHRRKVELVTAGVILICWAQVLYSAATLNWINRGDVTRGVMTFLGTAHRADPALDILVALSCAIILQMIWRPSLRNAALTATIVTVNFLWHPREFFQAALYLGVFGVALVSVPHLRKRRVFRSWALTFGLFVATALVLLGLSKAMVPAEAQAYDEMRIKRTALQYAVLPENLSTVRNFFHIPYTFMISSFGETEQIATWSELRKGLSRSWQLDLWLFLSGVAIVGLGVFGFKTDRALAMFLFWVWLLALAWNFSMLLVAALTYSEFFTTTQRLTYLFGYVAIADFLVALPSLLTGSKPPTSGSAIARSAALAGTAAILGFGAWWWQRQGLPSGRLASNFVTVLMWLAAAWVIVGLRAPLARARRYTSPVLALLPLILLAPFLGERALKSSEQPPLARAQPDWFGKNNPFGLSPSLIEWVRGLPAGQTFLVSPGGRDCVHLYAAVYPVLFPVVNDVLADRPDRALIDANQHPLVFKITPGDTTATITVRHEAARQWLTDRHVNYLLLNHDYYDSYLRDYVGQHPDDFQIAFANGADREVVVRFLPNARPERH